MHDEMDTIIDQLDSELLENEDESVAQKSDQSVRAIDKLCVAYKYSNIEDAVKREQNIEYGQISSELEKPLVPQNEKTPNLEELEVPAVLESGNSKQNNNTSKDNLFAGSDLNEDPDYIEEQSTSDSSSSKNSIFQDYLSLTDERFRWSFISKCVSKKVSKRRYVLANQTDHFSRRQHTLVYTLTSTSGTHQVCKKMFLGTLDISGKKIETVIKKTLETGVVEGDKRGLNPATNKIAEGRKDIVRSHINSIPVVESHYCRNSSKRMYLQTGLSETRLYQDYLKFCKERQNKSEDEKLRCQHESDLHILRKQEAREHKKADKELARNDLGFRAQTLITNKNKNVDGNIMRWLDVKWLQFRKDSPLLIYYKNQLSDNEFKQLCIRRPTRKENTINNVKQLYQSRLPIDGNKLKDLVSLCNSNKIPPVYHQFSQNLDSTERSNSDHSE
ncbi:unnamed protein product [Psylliodes chrysocephalus]|uniref:Uncharacterized protein n=1 Tax=Psylliodes chrysocephalus TaxID=3402493 RepID=A0A9P0G744_9CUCU|nr:unnamed protein product [Psylliodes chrysocephala]